MNKALWLSRMALGGVVCGVSCGIVIGAIAGMVLGLLHDKWAYGLDGALLGGGFGAGVGALCGLVLGWRDLSQPVQIGTLATPEGQTRSAADIVVPTRPL